MTCKKCFSLVLLGVLSVAAIDIDQCKAVPGGNPNGDYDNNGTTDAVDYTIWRDTLGSTVNLGADADSDGQVGASDYLLWKDNYGFGTSLVASSVAFGTAPVGPTVSVTGVVNGPNIDWTVFFLPDDNLFSDNPPNGVGGSLAVEFSFEVADGTLLPGTVMENPDFLETIMGVPIVNPGNDPYAGDISIGTQTYSGVASQLGQTGTYDAIFSPLGSTYFTSGGPKEALTFSTTGTSGTVTFGGIIAQGAMFFTLPAASATVIPEPASISLVGLGVLLLSGVMLQRRLT